MHRLGFFDKLAFWKKKDDFGDLGKDLDLGKDFGKDLGMDINQGPSPDLGAGLEPMGQSQQQFQKYPSFQGQQNFSNPSSYPQPYQQPASPSYPSASNDPYIASKNLEVISSKLDALKASINALNQRVANIEAIARGEQEEQRRKRYY